MLKFGDDAGDECSLDEKTQMATKEMQHVPGGRVWGLPVISRSKNWPEHWCQLQGQTEEPNSSATTRTSSPIQDNISAIHMNQDGHNQLEAETRNFLNFNGTINPY